MNQETPKAPKLRFKEYLNSGEYKLFNLNDVLIYEQPSKYIVKSTEYNNKYKTPVLTAGKTFLLGYTVEEDGVFEKEKLPIIIFDDFTTAKKFVNFQFKVKSGAIKILKNKDKTKNDIRYIFNVMNMIKFQLGDEHKRYWISEYSKEIVKLPNYNEQVKVADFFEYIDKYIENLKSQKGELEKYKKGMMQKIFSQELRFKDLNGKDYPIWERLKLSEIATFRRGSFPQPYGLPKWYDEKNGSPFVQVFDVGDNMKLKEKTKQKISDLAKPSSVFVKQGSIVLTIQGSIGRVAITQYDAYVDRTLLIFQSFNKPVDIYFFAFSLYLLFEIEKTKAPGGTIKTITKESLSNFMQKMPTLSEQQKIGSFLRTIDLLIITKQEKIENAELWKKGLMQRMII